MKTFSLRLWSRNREETQSDEPAVVDGITVGEKRFGIRSYLNQFYLSSPTIEDLENPSAWYLLPPPPLQRASSYLCRIVTLIGLLLLLAGAGFIIVGYVYKPSSDELDTEITRIAITRDEDGDFFIDRSRLNELLHQNDKLKVAGFIVFALGAMIVALSLVVPTCLHFFARNTKRLPFSEDNTPNEPPIRIYPSSVGSRFKVTPNKLAGPQKISPSSGPVPVMQEFSNIQPSNKRSAGNSPTADQLLIASDSEPLLP